MTVAEIKPLGNKVLIKPLGNKVLIKPDAAETKTASGIIIPDTAQQKSKSGVVVAIGKGLKDEPMQCSIGDKVMYPLYGITDIELEGEPYILIREDQLWAIL